MLATSWRCHVFSWSGGSETSLHWRLLAEEDRHFDGGRETRRPIGRFSLWKYLRDAKSTATLERERRFTSQVHDIVRRGGRCLIPVFALGRAQELLLILTSTGRSTRNYTKFQFITLQPWPRNAWPSTKHMWIWWMKRLGNKLHFPIRSFSSTSATFVELKVRGSWPVCHDDGLLDASNGLSRELFERWCPNKLNGVIIAGLLCRGNAGQANFIGTKGDSLVEWGCHVTTEDECGVH